MSVSDDTAVRRVMKSHTYITIGGWRAGKPVATIGADDMVNTRPVDNDVYISMTIERWREWNRVVEDAIAAHRDQHLDDLAEGASQILEDLS